ncbi:hypothetical protein [Nitrosovibrio sp. Nv17]|jgi:hypothetical protein|uniref:hypothetical protein n=1 Tax=Nitrosovibrio sp. Nv17 TaxID=1855339 RepID=UPI0009088E66|nr:hypothetical protein [Nitrosovibrio sp. Nv17]SFW21121.1 hypothetical protein SAMN05216414_10622 [Nitrosovibrio sp. Nv17]
MPAAFGAIRDALRYQLDRFLVAAAMARLRLSARGNLLRVSIFPMLQPLRPIPVR